MSPEERAEVRSLAARLLNLTDVEAVAVAQSAAWDLTDPVASPTHSAACFDAIAAAQLCATRGRIRKRLLDMVGVDESQWAILVDLYLSQEQNSAVSVTSAALASGAPATTALRYLAQLRDLELIVRVPDSRDQRRTNLELTDAGVRLVIDVLKAQANAEISVVKGSR